MKSTRSIASLSAILLSFATSNIAHAQAAQPQADKRPVVALVPATTPELPDARANVATSQAADAARRDTDPKLNGSIGDVPAKRSNK